MGFDCGNSLRSSILAHKYNYMDINHTATRNPIFNILPRKSTQLHFNLIWNARTYNFYSLFHKKTIKTQNMEKLKTHTIGAIIITLGLFWLWNYLSWVFFGKPETWSYWYLWFLGNLNLWLLSIPLVGLPLLFKDRQPPKQSQTD